MPKTLKAHWKIRGYKDTELVFDKTWPGGYTNGEIKMLLQRLACRDLTPDEYSTHPLVLPEGMDFLSQASMGHPMANA